MLSTCTESPDREAADQAGRSLDIAVFTLMDDELKLLCIRAWSRRLRRLLGFPVASSSLQETLDECGRELEEERLVSITPYCQRFGVYSLTDHDPRERVVSIAYLALVRADDKAAARGDRCD